MDIVSWHLPTFLFSLLVWTMPGGCSKENVTLGLSRLISINEDGRAYCSGQDLHLLKLERHLELEARMRNTQHRGLPCADGILC